MMLNKSPQINKLFGFTLVEILVALAISSILLLGVVQIFSTSKHSHKVNEALARVQENARYAMENLLTDLRQAGYVGCSPSLNSFVNPATDPDLFDLSTATGGWEYTASATVPGGATYNTSYPRNTSAANANQWTSANNGDLPTTLAGRVVPGTDVIVIKWAQPIPGITGKFNNNQKSVSLGTNNPHGFTQGGIVIVGDCRASDAFMSVPKSASTLTRATAKGIPPGNTSTSSDWSKKWTDNSQFMAGFSRVYYIGEGAGGGPALFTASYQNGTDAVNHTEIAEGIENMQILFGADTSGNGILDTYRTALNVSHGQVVGVQVGLVARSEDEALKTSKARTLNVLGINIKAPDDRRLRYVFTGSIKLRNKGAR